MAGDAPGAARAGGDAGASQGFSTGGFEQAAAQQVWSSGGFSGGAVFSPVGGGFPAGSVSDGGLTFSSGDAGAVAATSALQGDAQAEIPKLTMTSASSESEANLIINKDGKHEWTGKAIENGQCRVWVDEAAKADPNNIRNELSLAKQEAEQGKIPSQIGKKATFNVSEDVVKALTTKSNSASDSDDDPSENSGDEPEDNAPNCGGGGRGGGGGGGDPADDEKEEGNENGDSGENNDPNTEVNNNPQEQSSVITAHDYTANQLDHNGGMNNANFANYAINVWQGSMMQGLYSRYAANADKNGDGKIDAEEAAAMQKEMENDPNYGKAQEELNSRIGDDPGMADFKKSLSNVQGMSNLDTLVQQGDNAQSSHVNSVFNNGAQTAIKNLVISQELKAAGINANDSAPKSAAEEQALQAKIKPILNRLVNGRHSF